MQLQSQLIDRFQSVDSFLLIDIIKTVKPRLALEIAYASRKSNVIEAVRARIALIKLGEFNGVPVADERAFFSSLRQFRVIEKGACLNLKEGKLVTASSFSGNKKCLRNIRLILKVTFARMENRQFNHLPILVDVFVQGESVRILQEIRSNLIELFNRSLKHYNKSLKRLFSDDLTCTFPDMNLNKGDFLLGKGENFTATISSFNNFPKLNVYSGQESSSFIVARTCVYVSKESSDATNYLIARVYAEYIFKNTEQKKITYEIRDYWNPIFYAVGLISYVERNEEAYVSAVSQGKLFAHVKKPERLFSGRIKPHKLTHPKDLEKRQKILDAPMLNIVDSDIYRNV